MDTYDDNTPVIRIEKVTCLSVVNTGTNTVYINNYRLAPQQKTILLPSDNTYSNVVLNVKYEDTATKKTILLNYRSLD